MFPSLRNTGLANFYLVEFQHSHGTVTGKCFPYFSHLGMEVFITVIFVALVPQHGGGWGQVTCFIVYIP